MSDPSITCPKCGLTSYNRADIECRYCGKCGYHDADPSVPPGVPGKSAKWRQPTPAMQIMATVASLEGQIFLWKDDISTQEHFEEMLERHLADFKELAGLLKDARWPEV